MSTWTERFEEMRGYWPEQAGNDETGVADYLNDVRKYVVSGSLTDPEWDNNTVLSGDPADEVRALKEAPGGDIVATGSLKLTEGLVGCGPIDEYRMFVFPVVLGRGRRLFEDATDVPDLKLMEARRSSQGSHCCATEARDPGAAVRRGTRPPRLRLPLPLIARQR